MIASSALVLAAFTIILVARKRRVCDRATDLIAEGHATPDRGGAAPAPPPADEQEESGPGADA
jgi:hypothetical protein